MVKVTKLGSRNESFASSDDELFREQMRSSAHGDGANPRTFAYLLIKGAERGTWERLTDARGKPFGSFTAFLTAPNPHGLAMDPKDFLHAAALAGIEPLAKQLLNAEIEPVAVNGEVGRGRATSSRVTRASSKSDTEGYVVARLKRDNPELAERVVHGEIAPNAAAVQMGWRKPRIVVTSPASVAAALRRHMSPEDLAALIACLLGDTPDH